MANKKGRKPKSPDAIKRRACISCEPENFEYINAFGNGNKSKAVNDIIHKFKKDNPDYLMNKLMGKED